MIVKQTNHICAITYINTNQNQVRTGRNSWWAVRGRDTQCMRVQKDPWNNRRKDSCSMLPYCIQVLAKLCKLSRLAPATPLPQVKTCQTLRNSNKDCVGLPPTHPMTFVRMKTLQAGQKWLQHLQGRGGRNFIEKSTESGNCDLQHMGPSGTPEVS